MPVDTTNGPFYDVKTVTLTTTGQQTINFDNVTDQTPKAVYAMVSSNTLNNTVENDLVLGAGFTTVDDRGFCMMGMKNAESKIKQSVANHMVASNGTDKAWIFAGNVPGGSSLRLREVDLSTGEWVALTDFSVTVREGTLDYYDDGANGKLFLFGGIQGATTDSNELHEYDLGTDTWSSKATATTGVDNHSSVIYNDALYIFGGNDGSGTVNTIQKYDIATNTWSTEDDGTRTGNPGGMENHSAVVSGTKMYVHSNSSSAGDATGLYSYDFTTQTWTALTSSPTAVLDAAMTVIGDNIYVSGGQQNAENLLQIYSISGNSWSSGANLPIPVSEARSVTDGTDLFVIGGDADDTGAGFRFRAESKYIQKYDVSEDSWTTTLFDNVMSTHYQNIYNTSYVSTALPWIRVPDFGNPSSADKIAISFDGFGTGSITIDVTSKNQDVVVTFVMIAGDNISNIAVGEVDNNGSASIGFEPDFVLMLSADTTANDQVEDTPAFVFGGACNRSLGSTQRSMHLQMEDSNGNYAVNYSSRNSVWHSRNDDINTVVHENTLTFNGTGFSLSSTEADIPTSAIYLALEFDAGVTEEAYYDREVMDDANLSSGVIATTGVGYKPGIVFSISTFRDNFGSEPDDADDVLGFSVFTENSQALVSIFSDQFSSTTDTETRHASGQVVNTNFADASSPLSATLDSMDSDGFSLAFTDFTSSSQDFDFYFYALPGVSTSASAPSGTKRAIVTIIT